jgi:beta-N-acetylhexosaminidase
MSAASSCGNLVIGGFPGASLPARFATALRRGERGGAVLFKRNLEGGPTQVSALNRAIHDAADETPILAVDQEGGRVARLHAPLLEVPPMRTVASWGDVTLAERIAFAVASELAALGFTTVFAPVLDVNTCASNPVIGDRAFGDDPVLCARFGEAWVRGLQRAGVLACGKHFPGHGDTSKDSHHDLPVVERSPEQLDDVELVPFRAAAAAGVAAMMTAHVVYPSLDPSVPATLSRLVCTELRAQIGLSGVLFSDDLEMRAIAARWPIEQASVLAVAAGCDAVLICSSEDDQDRAFEALVRECERSTAFRSRCDQAAAVVRTARRRATARPLTDSAVASGIGGPESRSVAGEIAQRLQA